MKIAILILNYICLLEFVFHWYCAHSTTQFFHEKRELRTEFVPNANEVEFSLDLTGWRLLIPSAVEDLSQQLALAVEDECLKRCMKSIVVLLNELTLATAAAAAYLKHRICVGICIWKKSSTFRSLLMYIYSGFFVK